MKVRNVTNKIKLLAAALCMVFCMSFVAEPIAVQAAEANVIMEVADKKTGDSYDIGWLGDEGNGAFASLEQEVKDTGNSAYSLFMAVGVVGLLLSIIACGIIFAVSGSGQDRSKTLGWLLRIAVGAILIFGAIAIVGIFQNIGGNLF